MFSENSKDVSSEFAGHYIIKKLNGFFHGSFQFVSSVFQGCFKKDLRLFHRSVTIISSVFQESSKEVSRKIISRKFQGSLALPRLHEVYEEQNQGQPLMVVKAGLAE